MAKVRLKIDLAGTLGDEAWKRLQHFGEIQRAEYGAQYGSSGECRHDAKAPHGKDEWRGALITLATPLLAQYAVSHYLEQDGVLDADVEE
ncbi:MAG TPA: hypothetical protein VE825_14025 [Terriglobales bacterium]|jgi:hypothetical protein|nr:hypothetical protein [Terriglobales bacterium]